MAFNDLVARKIKDFEQQGVPRVFERDLDLGNPQEPKRDNIVNVIVGARRCGKTYRLYQEMRRLQSRGVELDRMLYFNFDSRMGCVSAACSRYGESDRLCDGIFFQDAVLRT